MDASVWYETLLRPSWAPPARVFSPVWSGLYLVIIFTFGYVFYRAQKGSMPKKIAVPFALNLACNFAFTPLQFGLQSNILAGIDVVLVVVTLLWALKAVWPHNRFVAIANMPYLLWVCFATILQFSIIALNGW